VGEVLSATQLVDASRVSLKPLLMDAKEVVILIIEVLLIAYNKVL
jgi:hypothetical protein